MARSGRCVVQATAAALLLARPGTAAAMHVSVQKH
ncbi:hypothetical protein EZ242_05700 [Ramlibacter rhizophilus]|uniref:Uncharacterized protein n=1 Tax=Ramlibacter rhizophilus TaxID=1781167 RepID=A0A4Z0BVN8_9BURK|nr:hypothetical protein EZ242_05700 [Ramlibacter rhizophilus]